MCIRDRYFSVDDGLDTTDFRVAHRLVVHKVKARLVRVDLRTFLLHMFPEHFAQRLVHEVGCRVVAHGAATRQQINPGGDRIANLQRSGLEYALMPEDSSLNLLRVIDGENPLR